MPKKLLLCYDRMGMAVIELHPESPDFGNISSRLELGVGVLPHYIYYDYFVQKRYTTALGSSYRYQIRTMEDVNGQPTLVSATSINTGKYDAFTKTFDGSSMGLGWTLEMYMANNKQLYVSFGDP